LFRESGFELYWEGFRRNYQYGLANTRTVGQERPIAMSTKDCFRFLNGQWMALPSEEGFLVQNRGY
jgi:hypothetical protein